MKRLDLSREVKKEIWRRLDAGESIDVIDGHKIDAAALEKQRELWADFRTRNPKRIKNGVQKLRAQAA